MAIKPYFIELSSKLKVTIDYLTGTCTVDYSESKKTVEYKTYFSSYNMQYPPAFSTDKKRMYISRMEGGLYCHDVFTGEILWSEKLRAVENVEIFGQTLACKIRNQGIEFKDDVTGRLINKINSKDVDSFFRLSDSELFYGPKRKKYYIYDVLSLKLAYELREDLLNIYKCLSFIITDCQKNENGIVIKGFEQYRNMDVNDKKNREYERFVKLN